MGKKERRERDKKRRRREILDAARGVLFERGMSDASMNMIAEAAELSVGTLYLYFTNKEELFAALQEEGLDLLYEMVINAFEGQGTPQEKLQRMALAYLKFSEEYKSYFDIINYFISSPDVMFPEQIKQRLDLMGGRSLALVQKAILQLFPEEADLSQYTGRCTMAFWSTLHGMLLFKKMQDTLLAGEHFEQLYLFGVDRIIEGFLIGAQSAASKN